MPKGKSLKMKGSICNIPVTEVDVNCNVMQTSRYQQSPNSQVKT